MMTRRITFAALVSGFGAIAVTAAGCGAERADDEDPPASEVAQALTQSLRLPFPPGHTWYICQSYVGFSHKSNRPFDIGWTNASCNAGNNDSGGKPIVAPGSGKIVRLPNTAAGGDFASLLGAALFTGVGYFLAAMRREQAGVQPLSSAEAASAAATQPQPEPEPEPEPTEAEVEAPAPEERPIPREEPPPSTSDAERALHRELAGLREELRLEVVARHDAEKRVADLNARLVSCSQQVSALRAKLAASSGDDPARRSSTSITPSPPLAENRSGGHRLASLAPGLFGEIEELRREVAKLRSENDSLRVAAFTKRAP